MAIKTQEMEDNTQTAPDLNDSVSERVKSALDTLLAASTSADTDKTSTESKIAQDKDSKIKRPKPQVLIFVQSW